MGIDPAKTCALILGACISTACPSPPLTLEAGIGGDPSGCGDPGSHSARLADHSCACEPGFDWCSEALDDQDCCPSDSESDSGTLAQGPDLPCAAAQFEQLACVDDPLFPGLEFAQIWACNGDQWVPSPGYSAAVCMEQHFPFAFGCVPEGVDLSPRFGCGHGPGSPCDSSAGATCLDADIIDTCAWGRRTIDRCSRLCAELELEGPGFTSGLCVLLPDLEPEPRAECQCL